MTDPSSTDLFEPENEGEMTSKKRTPGQRIREFFRWSIIIGGGLFVVVHIYGFLLALMPVPITANMILRPDGTDLQKDWTRLEAISPYLVSSVIAAEDSRYCQHGGIDFNALQKAIENNASGGRRRGGSTISQQTAKNVFLWNGGGYARKGIEAYFTYFIEAVWGKRRTMEVYLNVAEWGDGIYGAEAAAQARFGKPASELTRREAALLASVLPSPNKWRVDPPGPYVSQRAGTIQSRARTVERAGYDGCITGQAVPAPEPRQDPPEELPSTPDQDETTEPDVSSSEENSGFSDMLNQIADSLETPMEEPDMAAPDEEVDIPETELTRSVDPETSGPATDTQIEAAEDPVEPTNNSSQADTDNDPSDLDTPLESESSAPVELEDTAPDTNDAQESDQVEPEETDPNAETSPLAKDVE